MPDFDVETLRDPDGLFPRNIIDMIINQDPERRRLNHVIRGIPVENSRFKRGQGGVDEVDPFVRTTGAGF